MSDPRTNERIRVPEVRLVGPGGEQVGVVRVEDALRLAREADLDLVEVAPNSRPPVVKIMDFGKFRYEQAQKAKEARRNQANTVLKEVRFRLKIDEHDYETKRKRAEGFLKAGDKVKAMILFRGREQSRPEMGVRLLQRFAEEIQDSGQVESSPTIDGRNMTMIIGPLRSKSDAKAELNTVRVEQKKVEQERRRVEAERQAAHQAEVEAARPAREAIPGSATIGEFARSDRPVRSEWPERYERGERLDRPSRGRSDRPERSDRGDVPERSRSTGPQARSVRPTPAGAPRLRAAAAPGPAASAAAGEAPARRAPGSETGTSASASKPAAEAVAKPAAKTAAKPSAKSAPKPAAKPAKPAAPKPASPKSKPTA